MGQWATSNGPEVQGSSVLWTKTWFPRLLQGRGRRERKLKAFNCPTNGVCHFHSQLVSRTKNISTTKTAEVTECWGADAECQNICWGPSSSVLVHQESLPIASQIVGRAQSKQQHVRQKKSLILWRVRWGERVKIFWLHCGFAGSSTVYSSTLIIYPSTSAVTFFEGVQVFEWIRQGSFRKLCAPPQGRETCCFCFSSCLLALRF